MMNIGTFSQMAEEAWNQAKENLFGKDARAVFLLGFAEGLTAHEPSPQVRASIDTGIARASEKYGTSLRMDLDDAWRDYMDAMSILPTSRDAFDAGYVAGNFKLPPVDPVEPDEPDDDYDVSEDRRQDALMLAIKANLGGAADLIEAAAAFEKYLRGDKGTPDSFTFTAGAEETIGEAFDRAAKQAQQTAISARNMELARRAILNWMDPNRATPPPPMEVIWKQPGRDQLDFIIMKVLRIVNGHEGEDSTPVAQKEWPLDAPQEEDAIGGHEDEEDRRARLRKCGCKSCLAAFAKMDGSKE